MDERIGRLEKSVGSLDGRMGRLEETLARIEQLLLANMSAAHGTLEQTQGSAQQLCKRCGSIPPQIPPITL